MKKNLFVLILLLCTSCSYQKYNIFGGKVMYAEDIKPEYKKAQAVKEYKEETIVAEKEESSNRPQIKELKVGEFPNIKDIPTEPKNFPKKADIDNQKRDLLSKTTVIESNSAIITESIFSGFDDELLQFTVSDIMSRNLPKEYKDQRALLSASIKNEISADDLSAIELIAKDRIINIKPILLSFNKDSNDAFIEETISTLLLMGIDPSMVYVNRKNSSKNLNAEVYLYY
ncbi:MAG: hypothetical protein OIF36_01420 [Alphaproteobacteria bacterium]|nr:hypothetical protein [Alphaproteobacteria bacterium]